MMSCARSHVLELVVVAIIATGCQQATAAPAVTNPIALSAPDTESVTESGVIDTARLLREELDAFSLVLPSPGATTPSALLVMHGEIAATEASLEFLIAQAGRLLSGDHNQQLNLLNGLLEKLQQFKDKLQKALLDDAVSDAIRRAAATPLSTAESLQSLVTIALTCRTDVDC
jgi:hypothetical protein